jgi:hypothetical protein
VLEKAPDAFLEFAQLVRVLGVGKRKHRHGVLHRGKFFQRRGADFLRRRIRCGELGMVALQFEQAAK